MRMQLLRVCALLMVAGAAVAADKPKKDKPTSAPLPAGVGIGSMVGAPVGQATGNPKTGAVVGSLLGPDAAAQTPPAAESSLGQKFTVTKPVGTWLREVQLKGNRVRVILKVEHDTLTLKAKWAGGMSGCLLTEPGGIQIDADYAINKESCLFGVIDTFSTDQPVTGDAARLLRLSGQPFSVRFRFDEKTLSIKDFKGFGLDTGADSGEGMGEMLLAMCGQYAAVDPSKPLPPLKESKKQGPDNGPHLTPERIHGGILKADPPKEDVVTSRLGGVPYPTPHYLKHYPTYFAPDPPFPLQRERDAMLDPTGELGRRPVTAACAGPVQVAASELCANRPSAEVVQTKAEEPAPLKLQPVPPPQCDPPTDAEVMAVFNSRPGKDGDQVHVDITIVKNKVKDQIDPARLFPVVGTAQLHHCHWECSVYFNETSADGKTRKPKVEVVYIDTDCLRVCPAKDAVVPQRMPER